VCYAAYIKQHFYVSNPPGKCGGKIHSSVICLSLHFAHMRENSVLLVPPGTYAAYTHSDSSFPVRRVEETGVFTSRLYLLECFCACVGEDGSATTANRTVSFLHGLTRPAFDTE
jgi:hypothetical protein